MPSRRLDSRTRTIAVANASRRSSTAAGARSQHLAPRPAPRVPMRPNSLRRPQRAARIFLRRVAARLLIIADAAAEIIVGPGYEAYLPNERIIGVWRWAHIADLANLTFRLLHRGVNFLAKRLARRILAGAHVHAKRLLEVGIANCNERAVASICAKHIEVPISESPFSLVEHVKRFGLIRFHSGDCFYQHGPGFVGRTAGLLSKSRGRERDDRGQHRGEFTDHSVPLSRVPTK